MGAGTSASNYDGTNDYAKKSSNLTGSADGKTFTWAGWVKFNGGDGVAQRIFSTEPSGGKGLRIYKLATNKILVQGDNAAGTLILQILGTTALTASSGWNHLYISTDQAAGTASIYLNGSDDTSGTPTVTDDTLDLATGQVAVGAQSYNGAAKINACLSEIWYDDAYWAPGTYVSSFVSGGAPVELGSDGSTPTSAQPLIYAPDGDPSTNAGTGGNLTITGALTACSDTPGTATDTGVGSSAGTSTVTATSSATKASPGSSAGAATVTGVSSAAKEAAGSSTGTGTVSGVGEARIEGVGASTGAATVSGVGESLFQGIGAATGAATVSATSTAAKEAAGSSAGTGTATATSSAVKASPGASTGVATVTGVGASVAEGVGAATGAGTVAGVGAASTEGVGASTGSGAATGVGAATAASLGASAGTSTAAAISAALKASVGAATGTATVAAVGSAKRPCYEYYSLSFDTSVTMLMDITTAPVLISTPITTTGDISVPISNAAQNMLMDITPETVLISTPITTTAYASTPIDNSDVVLLMDMRDQTIYLNMEIC